MKQPQTLKEAIEYFANPETCFEYVVNLRWQDGIVTCPRCQSENVSFVRTRRIWNCLHCRKQFSIKTGTIFQNSTIGLDKWLATMWLIANAKNGVSSCEIARAIGVTQKTAWFMDHRIRLAMQVESSEPLTGEVEADETYIGGKAENMHKARRERVIRGRGASGKTAVFGMLERQGRVRTKVVQDTGSETLQREIAKNVKSGATIYTDAFPSYEGLDPTFVHEVIDHAVAYVNGRIHTNGMENFWSLLKRCLHGTYIHVDPEHLFRYLDEETFRFDHRKLTDAERFVLAVANIVDKSISYNTLTRKTIYRQLHLPMM